MVGKEKMFKEDQIKNENKMTKNIYKKKRLN